MARIAILGIQLESNRFAPLTKRSDFKLRTWLEGDAILRDAKSDAPRQCAEIPAFLEELHCRIDAEVLPILVAAAEPGGPLDESVLESILTKIQSELRDKAPIDAVYIASHGAMVGAETLDPDGAILQTIRDAVGPDIPIIATLDLHANLSDQMAETSSCLIGYRTNPHVDQADVAREAAVILARMVKGATFHMAYLRLPFTPASVTLLTNGQGAYAERVRDAAGLTDPKGAIVNATVLGGFVYSDTPDNGIAALVTATDRSTAERETARLAGLLWADRHRFVRALTSIPDAVRAVTVNDGSRWILSDAGDNPGGGGRGTSTDLLRALIASQAENVLCGLFIDPDLAQEANSLGIGAKLRARFLRRSPDGFGEPFTEEAKILALR